MGRRGLLLGQTSRLTETVKDINILPDSHASQAEYLIRL